MSTDGPTGPPPEEAGSGTPHQPQPDPEESLDSSMTMMEHLEELRTRMVISGVGLILGLIISAIPVPGADSLTWKVIQILIVPVQGRIQGIAPGEVFFTYLKIALVVGAALAMPVLVYQALKFVLPALLPHEKKYIWFAVPGVTLSFALGIAFGYVVLLPFAIAFLMGFGADMIEQNWSFGAYVSTVATLLFWMGLSFETPLVMYFLAKLRVVQVERLKRFRKYAFILAFVAGAIITPTPDPVNQTAVSIPLYLLFELGILLARFA